MSRVVLGIVAGLVTLVGVATPAYAANTVVTSTPAAGATLDASPAQILLTFAEALGSKNVINVSCNETPISVGSPELGADQRTLVTSVTSPLPRGSCVITWSVTAPDGTPDGTGTIPFEVLNDTAGAVPTTAVATDTTVEATDGDESDGDADADPSGATTEGRSNGPQGLMRLLSLAGVAVLFGALFVIALAWPEGVEYILAVRFLRWVWVVAVAGSFLHVVTLAAFTSGDNVAASILPTAWVDLADSGPGRAALLRLVLVGASGWVVARPERVIDQMTQMAALAMPALAVATFGFSRSGGPSALLGYAAGVVHALAMAVWFGGLVLLARVVLSGPGDEDLVHAVRGYSRLSTPAIIATVVSGGVQVYRLDGGELFSNAHGRIVLLKALVVAAMVFVGTAARQLIREKLSRANALGPKMADRLRRALGMEAAAAALALALSAWMLSTLPPKVTIAAPRNVGPSLTFRNTDGSVEVTIAVTQVVGGNAVRAEVIEPPTGLSDLTFLFTPPDGSGGTPVVFIVPALAGTGAVEVDLGPLAMPLDAPGSWKVTASLGGVELGSTLIEVTNR